MDGKIKIYGGRIHGKCKHNCIRKACNPWEYPEVCRARHCDDGVHVFYTMVDGLFVSNLIGTDALSAVNLTAPVIQLVTAISTMLATGGSAVIMKKMGEQKTEEAKEDFTFLILVNVIVGIVMCAVGYRAMVCLQTERESPAFQEPQAAVQSSRVQRSERMF